MAHMGEFPGTCHHRHVKQTAGRQAVCLDCGRPIFLVCGPCEHEFQAWEADQRYERCIYCAAVRRAEPLPNWPR